MINKLFSCDIKYIYQTRLLGNFLLNLYYRYLHQPELKQQQILKQVFQIVSKRGDEVCNFIEGGDILGDKNLKIIYRHYATLYIVFCVDPSESELAILDLIQVFVETLDKCFRNVCELDLVFHVEKVHYVLNEIITGGLVAEDKMPNILQAIEDQKKLEKNEIPVFYHETH
ncbi:AP-3 complex subunit sigma-2-like isoform X2 [Stegodyphus dumicola]|uniref:AP-3 complex subunit sigma-2-like isoform X2 n=1 Tax=Stegodyphus dumicola TaxID=202533 RepID=UPI0015A809BA|nr:AP-3 complex subunit sigma-2-like isoform X2 [Stegodyphus dumicola]